MNFVARWTILSIIKEYNWFIYLIDRLEVNNILVLSIDRESVHAFLKTFYHYLVKQISKLESR